MAVYNKYNSIFDYSKNEMPDGHHLIMFRTGLEIPIEVINITVDTIDAEWITSHAIGDDVADNEMLFLIAKNDLTIANDVILTPQTRKKSLVICCHKKLTNLGKISMTARGAIGAGNNVPLYRNEDGTYEVLPATGAIGGIGISCSSSTGSGDNTRRTSGKKGEDGLGRMTGGGGSGSAKTGTASMAKTLDGGAGTSYSGGSGSGSATSTSYGTAGLATGGAPGSYGGNGGDAASMSTWNWKNSGGAGNPGGVGAYNKAIKDDEESNGETGTGGTIILYARELDNQGTIESNGSNASQVLHDAGGGASGGGSVNVFYSTLISEGTITANGGLGGLADSNYKGGNGGNGTVTLQSINFDANYDLSQKENKYVSMTSLKEVLKKYTKTLMDSGIGGGGNSVASYCYQDIIKLIGVDSPTVDLNQFYDSDHHKITRVELLITTLNTTVEENLLSTIDGYEIVTLNENAINLLMTKEAEVNFVSTPIKITIKESDVVTMEAQIGMSQTQRYYLSKISDQIIEVQGNCSMILYVDYESSLQSMEINNAINSEVVVPIVFFNEITEIRNGIILDSEILFINNGITDAIVNIEEQGLVTIEMIIPSQTSQRYQLPKTKNIKINGSGNLNTFTYINYVSKSFYQ